MGSHGDRAGHSVSRDSDWFDRTVAEDGDFDPFLDRGWKTLGAAFSRSVSGAEQMSILDVGCGTGSSRQIYAGAVKAYVGLDHSIAALAYARRSHSAFVAAGDALSLPFVRASFDVVAFSSVLHHIHDRTAALREADRVLRPGGRVFAFDPNLLHPALAVFRHPASPLYNPRGVSPEERPLLPSELAKAFREAGFVDVRQRAQANIPYRQVAVGLLDRLLPLYNLFDWVMDRTGMGRWFGSFIISSARKA